MSQRTCRYACTVIVFGRRRDREARRRRQSQPAAVIEITVTADTRPVPQAQVIVGGKTSQTDANGRMHAAGPAGSD